MVIQREEKQVNTLHSGVFWNGQSLVNKLDPCDDTLYASCDVNLKDGIPDDPDLVTSDASCLTGELIFCTIILIMCMDSTCIYISVQFLFCTCLLIYQLLLKKLLCCITFECVYSHRSCMQSLIQTDTNSKFYTDKGVLGIYLEI